MAGAYPGFCFRVSLWEELTRMRKRLFALLLAACLVAGLAPAVSRAEVIEGDGYTFDAETGTLHIKNDAGSTQWRSDPDIPKEAVKSVTFQRLDTPVLNLGPSAFEGCVNLTGTIKLNADATSIGENAFLGCDQVELILIPEAAQADIETAGIPEQTAYMVYRYDQYAGGGYFYVCDVHYGSLTQIVFDGEIFDGTWSCGVVFACEETYNVVPKSTGTAWHYRTEADGEITITKYITNPSRGNTIELPQSLGDLAIKQYAPDAFSYTGLSAKDIIIVGEGIQATIPEEISKVVIKTENGEQVAYLTAGTSGSIADASRLWLPGEVGTLFLKDINVNTNDLMMSDATTAVYYSENAGEIVITDVQLGMLLFEQEYVVPATVEGKPVTTVMINTWENYRLEWIVTDSSVNKILYERNRRDDAAPCTITQIVQGDQDSVELPQTIAGRPVGSVPETAFDESVESIVVPEGLDVAQPDDVCKLVYALGADGQVTVTDVIPGRDGSGALKPVTAPGTIAGQTPVFSEAVQEKMKSIPHTHAGGTATCVAPAACLLCGQAYGAPDAANHANLAHVARTEPTCTTAGNIEYWTCGACRKAFSDAGGKDEIALADTVIAEKGHRYENGTCTVCGAVDGGFQPAMIAGANGVWQGGGKEGLAFTSNAGFADFIKVQVDSQDLAPSHYTAQEGSTKVTLRASYLETLPAGRHTIAIVSRTGTASAAFTILAAPADDDMTEAPMTGDGSRPALWLSLLLLSGAALAAAESGRRRCSR